MIQDLIKQGTVEETLFIPLNVKANETKREKNVINDPKAVEIIDSIDLDLSKFDGGNITNVGIIARTEVMDQVAKNYIQKNPNGLIINIGAGLDTRITRVDNGKIRWIDIDMPNVIETRKLFFEENDRIKFVGSDALDENWLDEVPYEEGEPVLIFAEGILMYFTEAQLKKFFGFLTKKFKNAEMCFDVVHSYFVGKGVSAPFVWGIEKAKDIEAVDSNIELVQSWSTGDLHKERQNLYFRIMNVVSSIRNRSQILHIRFRG